jgi:predicted nucleic acid-binding protein
VTIAIVDTGFIVAILNTDDDYHQDALTIINDRQWRLYLPVVTLVEVFYLRKIIKKPHIPRQRMLKVITEELGFELEDRVLSDYRRVSELLEVYAHLKIDYVDAAIVAIAERYHAQHIMTLDERDFRRYKPNFADYFILPVFDIREVFHRSICYLSPNPSVPGSGIIVPA